MSELNEEGWNALDAWWAAHANLPPECVPGSAPGQPETHPHGHDTIADMLRCERRRVIVGRVLRFAQADVLATHDADYGEDYTPECGVLVVTPRPATWAFDFYPTDWDGSDGARAAESRALAATR